MSADPSLVALLDQLLAAGGARLKRGAIVFLTGAGVSAESGVPTFRGPEGYWTIGSKRYMPEEMATSSTFRQHPWELWRWYLLRHATLAQARPNAAHEAMVRAEALLGPRFHLITQNVDDLHRLAGQQEPHLYEVHGNLKLMRCSRRCTTERYPLPEALRSWGGAELGKNEQALLRCPRCGGRSRPHVLWFDEVYEEEFYRSDAAMDAVRAAALLVVVGSSGSTTLPLHALGLAARYKALLVDINTEPNEFQAFIDRYPLGLSLQGPAGLWVPLLVDLLASRAQDART